MSGTGLYQPPHVITNAELVQTFNAYADLQNAKHGDRIAAGELPAVVHSSVELIEKASGIRQRDVIDKQGVLDPTRMRPCFEPRADEDLSLMAEIAVDAALCAAAMQRAFAGMACEIQQAIGAGGYGFDMNVACSSATFAIEQAANAVRSGTARCVRIVNPEVKSAHLEWRDATATSSSATSAPRSSWRPKTRPRPATAGASWAPSWSRSTATTSAATQAF